MILVKPKNALVKQYQKLFEMDGVELEFDEGAVKAVAEEAIKRNTGARGLRTIIEETMQNIMFDVPSNPEIAQVVVTEECVTEKKEPKLIMKETKKTSKKSAETKKDKSAS